MTRTPSGARSFAIEALTTSWTLGILEDLALVLHEPGSRVALAVGLGQVGLLRVEGHELAAAADDGVGLAVDVPVVQPIAAKRMRDGAPFGSAFSCACAPRGLAALRAAAAAVPIDA